jgi:hypothetical protein
MVSLSEIMLAFQVDGVILTYKEFRYKSRSKVVIIIKLSTPFLECLMQPKQRTWPKLTKITCKKLSFGNQVILALHLFTLSEFIIYFFIFTVSFFFDK